MSEPVSTTEAASETHPVPRWRHEPETYSPRYVARETAPHLHVEDRSDINFRGDVEFMLQVGAHFGLDDRDYRFLNHLLKTAIRHSEARNDGTVNLSDRQWITFKVIRRKFNRSYRDASSLINFLAVTRGANAQSSTAAPINHD